MICNDKKIKKALMEYADSLVTGYKLQDEKVVTNSTKGTSAS